MWIDARNFLHRIGKYALFAHTKILAVALPAEQTVCWYYSMPTFTYSAHLTRKKMCYWFYVVFSFSFARCHVDHFTFVYVSTTYGYMESWNKHFHVSDCCNRHSYDSGTFPCNNTQNMALLFQLCWIVLMKNIAFQRKQSKCKCETRRQYQPRINRSIPKGKLLYFTALCIRSQSLEPKNKKKSKTEILERITTLWFYVMCGKARNPITIPIHIHTQWIAAFRYSINYYWMVVDHCSYIIQIHQNENPYLYTVCST